MKKPIMIILANIILFLFFYLIVSFYSTSFNIKDWTEGARFAVVLLFTPLALLVSAYIIAEVQD